MMRTYGAPPKVMGVHVIPQDADLHFQYLPVKLPGSHKIARPGDLQGFDSLVGAACCDFVGERGLDAFVNSHVYVTAKRRMQGPGTRCINRPGFHTDGFGTRDLNYIWTDRNPTIFSGSEFCLPCCDQGSLKAMEEQERFEDRHTYPVNTLLRLDEYVVHKVADPLIDEVRTFVKISFSVDRYDLEGNSHNDLLDYDWTLRPRLLVRNVPQCLT